MKKELSRKEAIEKINEFFKEKHEREEVRKIKRLAMRHQIKLGGLRKRFCRKCYSMRISTRRIKNKIKTAKCLDCGTMVRWKIK